MANQCCQEGNDEVVSTLLKVLLCRCRDFRNSQLIVNVPRDHLGQKHILLNVEFSFVRTPNLNKSILLVIYLVNMMLNEFGLGLQYAGKLTLARLHQFRMTGLDRACNS